MGKADGLHRRLDWQGRVENDLRNRIRKVQKGDERVVKVVEELKKARIKTLRDEEWTIEERVVIKEE